MLQLHHRLGDFEILRLLGKGGMGEVYEARQVNPSRHVAIKILAPWLAENEEALQRFWREAEAPARLDHPGIVRIIATGRTDGVAWYAMHLVHGLSLAQLIREALQGAEPPTVAQPTASEVSLPRETPAEGRPAPPLFPGTGETIPDLLGVYRGNRYSFTIDMGIQAGRALAWAHRQGVLHRDIKPSNLMVDRHHHLYVVDFGLTRALVPDALTSLPGSLRGTPWYMSPEQARAGDVDVRSDVYSLGVTLYELASGGLGPYSASRMDSEAVLAQVKAGQALPLHNFAPDAPPELERIIARAIHSRAGAALPKCRGAGCGSRSAAPRRRAAARIGTATGLAATGASPAALGHDRRSLPHLDGRGRLDYPQQPWTETGRSPGQPGRAAGHAGYPD